MESLKVGSIIIFNLNFCRGRSLPWHLEEALPCKAGSIYIQGHDHRSKNDSRIRMELRSHLLGMAGGWPREASASTGGAVVQVDIVSPRHVLGVRGISGTDLQGNVLKERCSSRGWCGCF